MQINLTSKICKCDIDPVVKLYYENPYDESAGMCVPKLDLVSVECPLCRVDITIPYDNFTVKVVYSSDEDKLDKILDRLAKLELANSNNLDI